MDAPPTPEPVLALEGIQKTFRTGFLGRRRTVLADVDLRLAPGRRLGLIGPNGSGKSTLLRVACGVEPPDSGRAALFGRPLDDRTTRRRVGFLPEGAPFPAELTARRALELFAALHGLGAGERRERCPAMLARVGLEDAAGERLTRFSVGMLRRFGLAQAFLHGPELVLLDEPTAGLDAPGHAVLDELLAEAHGRGAALVLASHVVSDVVAHCDEVAVLVDGRIAARDAPAELAGEAGRVRVELEGLKAKALAELGRWVEGNGGRVLSTGPGAGTLALLYRRLAAGEERAGR